MLSTSVCFQLHAKIWAKLLKLRLKLWCKWHEDIITFWPFFRFTGPLLLRPQAACSGATFGFL